MLFSRGNQNSKTLGDILIERGWCSKRDIAEATAKAEANLGQELVEQGKITEDQLKDARFEWRHLRGKTTREEVLHHEVSKQRKRLRAVKQGLTDVARLSEDLTTLTAQVNGGK